MIEPLQQLIKLDRLICKDITVSLLCSLIKDKSDNFHRTVVDKLKQILHNSETDSENSFNAAILEILLTLNITSCDPLDVVKVSKANGLNILGALLLEQSLLPNAHDDDFSPTPSKRAKIDDDFEKEKTDKWVQLASIYKSLNDVDIVLSIFRKQSFGKDIQEAAIAEANGDWTRARVAFEKAYRQTKAMPSVQEHCLQGLLESVNNLCDWSAINNLVKSRASGNLRNVWSDTWRDWMIPYVCDAYVQMLPYVDKDDLETFQSWMNDPDKLERIKSLVGEDLLIFLLKERRQAGNLLNDLLDNMAKQWINLNPLCTKLRMRNIQKLQTMNDLSASLKVLRYTNEMDYLNGMTSLLDFWLAKVPMKRDNLVQWNKFAAYRTYCSTLFEDIFHSIDDNVVGNDVDKEAIRERMRRIGHELRLGIIDTALKQKHCYIAEKQFNYLKMVCWPVDLQPRLTLIKAKISCLRADLEIDVLGKMRAYSASWRYSHRLLNEESNLDTDTSTDVRKHISVLASTIERLSRENSKFAAMLLDSGNEILQAVGAVKRPSSLYSVKNRLLHYSMNHLKSCCDDKVTVIDRNVGEHYYTLAKHCYNQLENIDAEASPIRSDQIFQNFVFATLRAMYHDYHDATHYFSCLLRPERLLGNEVTRRIFKQECAKLQPWLFLRWRDLLFSYLGTSIAYVIEPIVERLVETYPNAVVYTYYLTIERNPAILHDEGMRRIRALLGDRAREIERFLTAIQYVVQPELYLKYYLNEATDDLLEGRATALESLLSKVYPSISSTNDPRPGNIYRKIKNHEDTLRMLSLENRDATRDSLRRVKERLDEFLQKRTSSNNMSSNNMTQGRLKDYSPFLLEHVGGGGIEIPGQYTGEREPMPRYHTKIARIDGVVQIMWSLRKPIRISMIGDNGREYKFLVKFGEDLTIDHGLQQLFATMNRTLRNDAGCSHRQLTIDTYEVRNCYYII